MIVDQLFMPKPLQEGGPYDLPGIDYDRPGDIPRRPKPSGGPIPRRHPDDPDSMDPDQRRLRADQARVKKAQDEYRAKKVKQSKLDEAMLLEDPVYRNFKVIGRYIAERKLTEPEILKVFADAEAGMTDKATGANRTFLGRGKDTTMDFAGGVADALKGVWSGIQSSTPVSLVDVAYDKATDALADLTGGQKGVVMQAINKYRMLAKEYPKTAGLAKGALVAITGLATGGAGLPAVAALIYGLDAAVKGEKFSDIALKAGGAAATAWAAGKISNALSGDAAAGSMGDPSQLPPFDDAGNLSPGFHISPESGTPYYNGELAPTPTDIAAGYGPGGAGADSVAGLADTGAAGFGGGTYTTMPGDQGGFIAQAQGVPFKDLEALNPQITNWNNLPPGTELQLPPSGPNTGSVWQSGAPAPQGPEILGGPSASGTAPGDNVFSQAAFDKEFAAMDADMGGVGGAAGASTSSPLSFDPATNSGTVTLPSGETIKASVFPQGGQFQPRLPVGGEMIKIPYGGQEVTGYVHNGVAYFPKFPADAAANATTSTAGTLSGVTAQQIYNSPVYQQIYAQEIARYGAEPSARAIQAAQTIATAKAKAAMVGAVRENTDWISTVKMRRLPLDRMIDQKLTTLSWALNESVGKPQGRSMHLTPLGVYTVFENIRRVGEAAVADVEELSPEEIARNERIQKMYQLTRGQGLSRDADGRLVGNIEDPDDPEGEGPPARLYYDDDYNLIRTSKPIPGVEVSTPTPTPKPGPTPTPTPKPGPTPTPSPAPAPMPKPGPTPAPLGPELKFGSPEDTINRSRSRSATTVPLTPTPAPTAPVNTTPTGPGREELPDLYRPDAPDAPYTPADPAKKSWFGKGLDYLDKGVKKVGGVIGNLGHQLTTNVTKEKLKMNWHQAGKPSDSDQLSAWLVKQGVPIGVVNGVYEKMGLPVSAEPTTPTDPTKAEPQARTGGAQRLMPFNNINPKTGQRWTVDDLEARRAERNAQAAAATDTTATNTAPAPTATNTTAGSPAGFNAGNVFKMPGMEKYAKSTPAKTPNFAGGPTGYGKTTMSVKPMTGVPGMKTTPAPAPTAAPAGTKVTTGGPTPDEKAKLAQRIAQATAKPVAEMLQMVETKEDVARIKQFVDQTFTKYGAVNESAFAIRNQILEHVTQVGAQRRREHSRKAAH